MQAAQNIEWYRDQVVFLTGGTGTLGGCLLYKLAVQLPTAKVFTLCRGSVARTIKAWEESMPKQVDGILDTGKIHFVLGDVTRPELGLKPADLKHVQEQTTVVINAAADVSWKNKLSESIRSNCVSHLTLVSLLASFARLKSFLHVSTAYANDFLPPGVVEERIYSLRDDEPDPEVRLSSILSTGRDPDTRRFSVPYVQAKHIAERLILGCELPFPVLIVRPSLIGPAIQAPHPLYGVDGKIPIHTFIQAMIGSPDYSPFQLQGILPQEHIVEEIPVDLVANTCLSHLAMGTTGIVHAAAELYVSRTTEELFEKCREYTPADVAELVGQAKFYHSDEQDLARNFFNMLQGPGAGLVFDCSRSHALKSLPGPIGLSLEGHDPDAFLKARVEHVCWALLKRLRDVGVSQTF